MSQEYPPETGWGGIGSYAKVMGQGLARRGHDVFVIAKSSTGSEYSTLDGDVRVFRLPSPSVQLPGALTDVSAVSNLVYAELVAQKLQELHLAVGLDVVEVPEFAAEGFRLSRLPVPIVVRLHAPTFITEFYNSGGISANGCIIDAMERFVYEHAALVTAPTSRIRRTVEKRWGSHRSVALLPNPIDDELFCPPEPDQKRLMDSPLVLYVGRLECQKGADRLVRAVPSILKDHPGAQFLFIGRDTPTAPDGTGSYLRYLQRLIRELEVPIESVRFVLRMDRHRLPIYYRQADVAVIPSLNDNMPYVALEAMASGVPVILPKHVGLAEYLEHRWDAALIDESDPDLIAKAVTKVLSDDIYRHRLAVGARKCVEEKFASSVIAARTEELYHRVVKEAGGRASGIEKDSERQPRVCFVILTREAREYTRRCIESIMKHTPLDFAIHLIDNGSGSETREWLKSIADPRVNVYFAKDNLGVPGGRNVGLRYYEQSADIVAFVDNDVEVFPGWHLAFLDALARPGVGAAGAQGFRLKFDGEKRQLTQVLPVSGPEACDILTGFCMWVRREVVDLVGPFDEELGMYWHDDDDYALRIQSAGYQCVVVPQPGLVHYGSKSSSIIGVTNLEQSAKNLGYLRRKWLHMGILDQKGQISRQRVPIVWEGDVFAYSSLALINRHISSRLLRDYPAELKLIARDSDSTFRAEFARYGDLWKAVKRPIPPGATWIRHMWPPHFSGSEVERLILIQPWEWGAIPEAWVQPMREQVSELWVPSSFCQEVYVANDIPSEKVRVIPNGVDESFFEDDGRRANLPPDGAFKFLFVGGTLPRKGIDILLKAYEMAFKRSDDVMLVIKDMGTRTFYREGNMKETILALARSDDYPRIYYLDGDIRDDLMPALYRSCHCLVHPYRGEGFAMPVAEAMAVGLPVIVTDGGGTRDYCTEENGYLLPAKRVYASEAQVAGMLARTRPWWLEVETADLAARMREVYSHYAEAKKRAVKGRIDILTRYTWIDVVSHVWRAINDPSVDEPGVRAWNLRFGDDMAVRLYSLTGAREICVTVAFREWGTQEAIWRSKLSPVYRVFAGQEKVTVVLVPDGQVFGSKWEMYQKLGPVSKALVPDDTPEPDVMIIDSLAESEVAALAARSHVWITDQDSPTLRNLCQTMACAYLLAGSSEDLNEQLSMLVQVS